MIDPNIYNLSRQQLLHSTAQAANVRNPAMMDTLQLIQSRTSECLKTFEKNFNRDPHNNGKICPSLDVFNNDAILIDQLLKKWPLDSTICFFDLLNFDLYDQWKEHGAAEQDLKTFCQDCQKLNIELRKYLKEPTNPHFFKTIRKKFQLLQAKIPQELQIEFDFLLKVLQHPQQAAALGISSVQKFGRNEVLDGEYSKPEHVYAFLNFSEALYPDVLRSASKIKDMKELSLYLNRSMTQLRKRLENRQVQFELGAEEYDRLRILKQMVDSRLFKKRIPSVRLFYNIQFKYDSKYNDWICKKLKNYLHDDFQSLAMQHLKGSASSSISSPDEAYLWMNILANKCRIKKLAPLEKEILTKLYEAKNSCTSIEQYGAVFCDMVRLYQIIHDIHVLKDVAMDHLDGRHIPDSFEELACFSEAEILEINARNSRSKSVGGAKSQESLDKVDSQDCLEEEVLETSPTTSAEMQLATSAVSESESSTKPADAAICVENQPYREQKDEGARAASFIPTASPKQEKPYFPSKNASGKEVMKILLNNGFVLVRTAGSHYQMMHVQKGVATTVPFHESIKSGTLSSIRKAFYESQGFTMF